MSFTTNSDHWNMRQNRAVFFPATTKTRLNNIIALCEHLLWSHLMWCFWCPQICCIIQLKEMPSEEAREKTSAQLFRKLLQPFIIHLIDVNMSREHFFHHLESFSTAEYNQHHIILFSLSLNASALSTRFPCAISTRYSLVFGRIITRQLGKMQMRYLNLMCTLKNS